MACCGTISLLLVIGLLVYIVEGGARRKKRKAALVDTAILPALKQLLDDVQYSPQDSISEEVITASDMVRGWTIFRGEDYISGHYNGLWIEMSDIRLQHTVQHSDTDSKGRATTTTEYVTDFRGLWLICDFGKKVGTRLTVRAGKAPRSGFLKPSAESKRIVEMEDVAFNEAYTVLTDDPHYAFYVLTPPMMEHIMATRSRINEDLSLEFNPDGTVHIAIAINYDFFEAKNAWKAIDYDAERARMLHDIRYILGILDQLKIAETVNP
jgi:hypothetical protein